MTDPAVAKLQALVRIPTVSDRDPAKVDSEVFDDFLAEHARLFPRLYAALGLTRVGAHGLLFHWAGASTRTAGGADGPPRRRTRRRVRAVAAPAVRRRDPRRRRLGARHPRRQGLPGRDLRGRRAAARRRLHPGPGPLAELRVRRGGLRYGGQRGGRRAQPPRGRAVVRGRRGRGHRGRRVPRHQAAGRRDRRDGEGRHERGAPGRGPRRPRVDAGEVRADRAAGPRHPACRPLPHGGAHPRRDGRPVPPARSARTAAPAAGDGQRRTAAAGCSPGRSSRPARSRPR